MSQTEAERFESLTDWARMKASLKRPLIFDGRNIYDPDVMREQGFTYFPIGRQPVRA